MIHSSQSNRTRNRISGNPQPRSPSSASGLVACDQADAVNGFKRTIVLRTFQRSN